MLPYACQEALRSPLHPLSAQEHFGDVPQGIDILRRVAIDDDDIGFFARFQGAGNSIDA